MSIEIEIENLGPIANFKFKMEYGINRAIGPNGCGKTHLLEGVRHLAVGKGGLPLRDGQSRGFIEGVGARLSIGAKSTRSTGEFELLHLEGKFDLGELVDPQMKSAEAADRKRIKALVQIMGVDADIKRFADAKVFPDFDKLMGEKVAGHTDLVDQSLAVKKTYEEHARLVEGTAERECGHAEALERGAKETDMGVDTDERVLLARYDDAKEVVSTLAAQVAAYGTAKTKEADARLRLKELEAVDMDDMQHDAERADAAVDTAKQELIDLQKQVEQKQNQIEKLELLQQSASNALKAAKNTAKLIEENERILSEFAAVENPEPARIAAAEQELADAKAAIDAGSVAREAARKLEEAKKHRDEEKTLRSRSEAYRAAAKSVDQVLSDAIQCDLLKVESHDGVARLVTFHQKREKYIPFHDLSHGEKWKIALQLGCDRVGEEGVLPISQESWEGIDAFERPDLIDYAKHRKVYVLTAEATRDTEDGRDLKCESLGA